MQTKFAAESYSNIQYMDFFTCHDYASKLHILKIWDSYFHLATPQPPLKSTCKKHHETYATNMTHAIIYMTPNHIPCVYSMMGQCPKTLNSTCASPDASAPTLITSTLHPHSITVLTCKWHM